MKVTGNQIAPSALRTRDVKKDATRKRAAPERVVDSISIAGIPEAELTPRVRQALTNLFEEVSQLRADLAEAQAEAKQWKMLAQTDPLLGIFNRRAFVQELNRVLAMVERHQTPASLVFIDLNDLKKINDNFGHAAGDEALAHVAQLLSSNIRQTDTVGRLGGDEFGLILMVTDEEAAATKAESLRKVIAQTPLELGGALRRLHIACGVVGLQKSVTAEQALGEADAKMYERKKLQKSAQQAQRNDVQRNDAQRPQTAKLQQPRKVQKKPA